MNAIQRIPMGRRGLRRRLPFPKTRKQLLDEAKRAALKLAFGEQSGAIKHCDCGSLPDGERWFCIQTKPGSESEAALRLRAQGFTTFVPARISENRRRFVPRPEIPRYLFVAFDPSAVQWRKICHTYGVARLFLIGERPAPARVGDVEGIIEEVVKKLGEPEPQATPGVVGRVLDGPLAGFRCVVVNETRDGHLRVNVEIFGRPSCITLERGAIRLDGE